MTDPVTGRLYIASKGVFGGTLYAVPPDLGPGDNRVKAVGPVLPVATDGAFFPDGNHLIVRDYLRAVVYSFPGLDEVGTFRLPAQRQGEGIAVDASGSVFVSTEGQHTPVLRVPLPSELRHLVTPRPESPSSPASPSAGGTTTPDVSGTSSPDAASPDAERWTWEGRPWWVYAVLGWAVLVVVIVVFRGVRRLRR
jgi:hypothetical protein